MKREKIVATIRSVLKKHGIEKAYLFGSFARNEKKYKDIDIAIEQPKGKFSLFDLVGVEQELEDRIGTKADVAILRSLKPALVPYIMKDLTAIL